MAGEGQPLPRLERPSLGGVEVVEPALGLGREVAQRLPYGQPPSRFLYQKYIAGRDVPLSFLRVLARSQPQVFEGKKVRALK
jgi:hypothetical protein